MPIRASLQTFALCAAVLTCVPVGASAGPVGFAGLDGGTPGGDPGKVCTVAAANESALRDAVDCAGNGTRGGIVAFKPGLVISLNKRVELPSNITIRGPATIQTSSAGIFHIGGQHNVIVTDIVFRTIPGGTSKKGRACPDPTSASTAAVGDEDKPGTTACTVPITIQGTRERAQSSPISYSKNIWIDHNTFSRCGDKCIVIKNGDKKASGGFTGADDVTISNNRFEDSFFGVLITLVDKEKGGARSLVMRDTAKCASVIAGGAIPRMRITVNGNYFLHVRRRMVRAAYCSAYVHEFNNVIEGFGLPMSRFPAGGSCGSGGSYGFGPSVHSGGRMLLENNYIAAWPNDPRGCKAAIDNGAGREEDEGYVKDVGNIYANGAFGGGNKPALVGQPSYAYTALPASEVRAFVTRNAGARSH